MRSNGAGMAAASLMMALAVVGCDFPSGERPKGLRFVTGSLVIPDEDITGRQNTGLQMAAIAIGTADDADDVDAATSAVFDGSRVENTRFSVPVAEARSFVLVLQVPSAAAGGFGSLVATLSFDDGRGSTTTLLPPGSADIELGALTVGDAASAATRALRAGEAAQPLAQVDTDGDGQSDLGDDDDDDDGVLDQADPDVGGDGVDDANQVLEALTDEDANGIPDVLEG